MLPRLVEQLQVNRIGIAADWTRMVMAGPPGNPLAKPETMVHLVVPSLERIVARLTTKARDDETVGKVRAEYWPPQCQCGRNPFQEFYLQGERALFGHAGLQRLLTLEEFADLQGSFRSVALEDIRSFDSVCLVNARAGVVGAR